MSTSDIRPSLPQRAAERIRDDWPTAAQTVQALAAVPGVVANERADAAARNARIARTLDRVVSSQPQKMYDLNRHADEIRKLGGHAARAQAAADAIIRAPDGAPIPDHLKARLADHAAAFAGAARDADRPAQTTLEGWSRRLGASVADVARNVPALAHSPLAQRIPVAGVIFTGAAIADDVARKHVDPRLAVGANVAGAAGGTALGVLAEGAVAAAAGTAVVAAAPAVAVVAGVVVAAGAGYAITTGLEHFGRASK